MDLFLWDFRKRYLFKNFFCFHLIKGIQLRKVERQHNQAKEIKPPLDVASILARRVAIELSESESSDSDEDDEEWMEQNANETSAWQKADGGKRK